MRILGSFTTFFNRLPLVSSFKNETSTKTLSRVALARFTSCAALTSIGVSLYGRISKNDSPGTLFDDVEKIEISAICAKSWPCQHGFTMFFNDGKKASRLNSYDIYSIVSKIAEEKINPGQEEWNATAVKQHFNSYRVSQNGWTIKTAEEVLRDLSSRKK